jgi:hypothetical protein
MKKFLLNVMTTADLTAVTTNAIAAVKSWCSICDQR